MAQTIPFVARSNRASMGPAAQDTIRRMLRQFQHGHPAVRTPAVWHPGPDAPRNGYAVALFRRAFTLTRAIPPTTIWVSASQRFELYLDGALLARGPSRSDPLRWGCVQVHLPRLAAGRHALSARVVHFGDFGGLGQMGGPAFLMVAPNRAGQPLADVLQTGPDWRCTVDRSYAPQPRASWGNRHPHMVTGSADRVDGRLHPWGWNRASFGDARWAAAAVVCRAAYDEWGNIPLHHLLRPDPLPHMTESARRPVRLVAVSPAIRTDASRWFARGNGRLTIPPRSRVQLTFDMGEVTNAYPRLTVSGGRGAVLSAVSSEAVYDPDTGLKGNRDETAGKSFHGPRDEYLADGGTRRTFSTLWLRSFRYYALTIKTAATPLCLDDFAVLATEFPLVQRAKFTPDPAHRAAWDRMWDVTWRTARCCAHETFFDCPHYEQMQFPGDTRVQAIFHYVGANEDRLARKAIDDFHASRLSDGVMLCKYPSNKPQIISTYGLYWVGMLYDFLVYRGDREFLRGYLPAAREVVAWFERRLRRDGMLGDIPYAPFIDWTKGFACGNAPQDENGGSSILTLLLAQACGWMAGLETHAGFPELAPRWSNQALSLARTTLRLCWDPSRGLLADTPSLKSFSQHAQIQAILADVFGTVRARTLLRRALAATDITPLGTFYFRYYLVQAAKRCGMSDLFFDILPRWEKCLQGSGLTTWPETDGPATRSDCHAWSVSPGIEFLETVLGVQPDPACPGYGAIRFQPALGPLAEARGRVPTPHGSVEVELRGLAGGKIEASLTTPVPITIGEALKRLPPGKHRLTLTAP